MKKILLIGYGNPTRMDDGVGWYIAKMIRENIGDKIDVMEADQLSVEMIEDIKDRQVVIFVDAHVSEKDDWIRISEVQPDTKLGLTAHIVSPSNLLSICQSIYNKYPKAYLYSVKGVNFDFGEELSEQTRKSADEAIKLLLCCIATLACAGYSMTQDIQLPKWQPHDFQFKSDSKHENPFSVIFSATVNSPDGKSFSMPGFYDGDGTWKVRLSPILEGSWSLKTNSDDPSLDGKSISFICVPNNDPKAHGGLLVDASNPYHFVYEDGTRYFMNGYECDWLWALDMDDPNLPTINSFLDTLAFYGFNDIILNAYAHDTSWAKGKTSEYDYGPPPKYAWEGTNENPIFDRFNLSFWSHYDRVIDAMNSRGITAHIMIKVYNKMVNWQAKESDEENLYFIWLIARYSAYPNVIWDFSKEANNEKDLDYKLNRFKFLRDHDPYNRLITNHDDKLTYDTGVYNGVLDFRSDQQHSHWHEKILSQRKQNVWPLVNVEFGYEHGPGGVEDKTYGVVQSPEEVCRRAWEICMAGGYIAYYYTYTAWDIIKPNEIPPGYAYFKYLYEFFNQAEYWLMEPVDELVSDGYCLGNKGKEYVVFLNEAKSFKIKLDDGKFNARWFDPFKGKFIDAGVVTGGEIEFIPPTGFGNLPIVLHLKLKN
jgi:hydrogenase maturation protease